MNGNNILLDTNILIHYFNGSPAAKEIIQNNEIYISTISEMELLAYPKIKTEEISIIKHFLRAAVIIDIYQEIKKTAIKIRRFNGLKLPNSIILATSSTLQIPLITADKQIVSLKEFEIINFSG